MRRTRYPERPTAIRAFLAILLPEVMVREATRIQSRLQREWGGSSVRWVDPANFHLTLRFFGNLEPDEAEEARYLVQSMVFEPMPVRFTEVSAFPNRRRPAVIWLGLREDSSPPGTLGAFVRGVEESLQNSGFGPSDKPWKAHLTLGRVARNAHWRARPDDFGPVDSAGSFVLDEVALMRSELRPSGPRYSRVETVRAKL